MVVPSHEGRTFRDPQTHQESQAMYIPASDHWANLGDIESRLRHILLTAEDRPDLTPEDLEALEAMADKLSEMFDRTV